MADEQDDYPIAAFKVGERDHLTELIEEGHVFMNTAKHFRNLEDGTLRSDSNEGATWSLRSDEATFKIQVQPGGEYRPLEFDGRIVFSDPQADFLKLYCLHGKRHRDFSRPFTFDRLELGKRVVVILNFAEFLRRLIEGAHAAGCEVGHGFVQYVPETYSGQMGPFRKFKKYEEQSEYRVWARVERSGPLSLRLGDLSDVVKLLPQAPRYKLEPVLASADRATAQTESESQDPVKEKENLKS